MQSFFRTTPGRLSLILGGVDLSIMGVASLVEDPAVTALLVALIPMLSIAAAINIIALSTWEQGGLLPVGLLSIALFLAGVYVYGLESATHAGPAAGVVLLVVGAIAALLGVHPPAVSVESPRTAESAI